MTYIIAEAGVNHNGSIDRAIKLIQAAKKAGAGCIKFQTFRAKDIVTSNSPKANYQLKVTSKKHHCEHLIFVMVFYFQCTCTTYLFANHIVL